MADSGIFIERCPHDKENPYVMTSRNLIRDEVLSMACRWMLIYLLSHEAGWKISVKQLWNHCKQHHGGGRDSVLSWIKEAMDGGYILAEEYLNENNLRRIRYFLSETPKFKKCLPRPEAQGPDGKGPADHTYKKEHVKEIKKKIIKEKNSPAAQTTPRTASRIAMTSKITFDKERRCFGGITKEDMEVWKAKFPALHVEHQIDLCAEWALSNHRKNYRKSIFTWLNNVQKSHTTPFKAPLSDEKEFSEEDVRSNEDKALGWEQTFLQKGVGGPYCIQASLGKVVFIMPNNEGYMVNYAQPKKEYEKKCWKALTRMKILNV